MVSLKFNFDPEYIEEFENTIIDKSIVFGEVKNQLLDILIEFAEVNLHRSLNVLLNHRYLPKNL